MLSFQTKSNKIKIILFYISISLFNLMLFQNCSNPNFKTNDTKIPTSTSAEDQTQSNSNLNPSNNSMSNSSQSLSPSNSSNTTLNPPTTSTNSSSTLPTLNNNNSQIPSPNSNPIPTNGINGPVLLVGDSGQPYTTIQSAINAANPGDTILVLKKANNGTYKEKVLIHKNGSPTQYISLISQDGAIIDGGNQTGVGVTIEQSSYIRVSGFEIQNFKGSGVPTGIGLYNSGKFIEISNNKIHHIEATRDGHGIAVYGSPSSSIPISNITISQNEVSQCKLGTSESIVVNGNIDSFIISKNMVHDNDNIAIDAIGFEGYGPSGFDSLGFPLDSARNGLITENTVYNISSLTNPSYKGERSADGIYVDGGNSIIIEKNKVDRCDIGIEAASEHQGKQTKNILIRNNFISRSFQANIMAGGYAANRGISENIYILNNTTYGGNGGEVALQFNWVNIVIQNNIFIGLSSQNYLQLYGAINKTGTSVAPLTSALINNNIYFNGASNTSPGDWSDNRPLFINPKVINSTTDPINLHLTSLSPAIDAGVLINDFPGFANSLGQADIDNQSRQNGAKVDMGADEFF